MHTAKEISEWAADFSARLWAEAEKAQDPQAKLILYAKAGSFKFVSERILDERPLKVG